MKLTDDELLAFVTESNRIEGIREVSPGETMVYAAMLDGGSLTVAEMEGFVAVIQPGAKLRRRRGLDVRVGNHIAPRGGSYVEECLTEILEDAASRRFSPYDIHVRYETLHPFTDGNGRSGRVLWLWMMLRWGLLTMVRLGFLHCWYYQSLQGERQ